ncbi:MAG: antibiotic biosynthesis monooxygenase [Actinomycetota bacterium]
MLAITRFSVPTASSQDFLVQIQQAHEVLSQCAGFKQGEFGQNVDDPNLWVLMTQWGKYWFISTGAGVDGSKNGGRTSFSPGY